MATALSAPGGPWAVQTPRFEPARFSFAHVFLIFVPNRDAHEPYSDIITHIYVQTQAQSL